jgi:hypothetical protein
VRNRAVAYLEGRWKADAVLVGLLVEEEYLHDVKKKKKGNLPSVSSITTSQISISS